MLEFKEITMADQDWTTQLMRAGGLRGSEYTFANLFNWSATYTVRIARFEDFMIARSGTERVHYLYPAGQGDFAGALNAMQADAASLDMPFAMYGIPEQGVDKIEQLYPGRFKFTPVRDNFDYLYSRESLATLAGKKLHGKRNHINRFVEAYPDWRYEPLTEKNIADAKAMNAEWCKQNGCFDKHSSLHREACAVRSAFRHFFEQALVGGVLYAGGKAVAFTFGSPVTDDTFVVHVEKAFSDIQGAYPMINQQFVKNALAPYEFVNREDDLGEEGLRRAKESYRPVMMYERYAAAEK
ncbi:MAG: DUF2156 domain-containing protein [Candidatus Fimivivens sp.]